MFIGSTAGLSGSLTATGITGVVTTSQLPKSSVLDQTYSETRSDVDSRVYGVASGGVDTVSGHYTRLVQVGLELQPTTITKEI